MKNGLPSKERTAELVLGYSAKGLVSGSFDYLLYPAVIFWLGILKGGAIMMALSFLACIAMMRFYDWSGHDWLGIEAIKGLREYDGGKQLGRFMSWVLGRSEPVIFLVLSINLDPFITTAYMRRGRNQFDGMSKRDWSILVGSTIVSNAYWTLACFMGITLVEWIWKTILIYFGRITVV